MSSCYQSNTDSSAVMNKGGWRQNPSVSWQRLKDCACVFVCLGRGDIFCCIFEMCTLIRFQPLSEVVLYALVLFLFHIPLALELKPGVAGKHAADAGHVWGVRQEWCAVGVTDGAEVTPRNSDWQMRSKKGVSVDCNVHRQLYDQLWD